MHLNDARVASKFVVQALLGRDVIAFGDSCCKRALFCCVDDLIDDLVRPMNTADDVTGPINIGNPQEFTFLN